MKWESCQKFNVLHFHFIVLLVGLAKCEYCLQLGASAD